MLHSLIWLWFHLPRFLRPILPFFQKSVMMDLNMTSCLINSTYSQDVPAKKTYFLKREDTHTVNAWIFIFCNFRFLLFHCCWKVILWFLRIVFISWHHQEVSFVLQAGSLLSTLQLWWAEFALHDLSEQMPFHLWVFVIETSTDLLPSTQRFLFLLFAPDVRYLDPRPSISSTAS